MKYLLDTHTLLWFFHNDPKLPESTKDIICSNVDVSVSMASFWEIAIKKSIGKLDISESVSDLEQLRLLPFIHRDPFDRLLISTAVEENLTLVTCDEKIQKYNLNILW